MESVLVLAHAEADGALSKASLEALQSGSTLARDLGGAELSVGLVGKGVQAAADRIAGCGAKRFLGVEGDEFTVSRYATDAAAAEALCRAAGASLVLAPATARWMRTLPGVSRRLQGRVDTHVSGIQVEDGRPLAGRWYYRQRMEAVLERTQRPWILLVDPGSQPAWSGEAGSASVESVAVETPESSLRTRVVGVEAPSADEQTIRPDASLLFVAGAGWTKKQQDGAAHVDDAEKLILGFLRGSKASLGSSKSLVDLAGEGQVVLSFMTHLHQIGQTGSTPRHPKGLATCCHGEEPHVVGWRFVGERRAVNLDPSCGWARGKADVLYVADAFQVMARVNELLGKD